VLVGHGGAEDAATEPDESVLLADVLVPLELAGILDEDAVELDVAIHVEDQTVELPGPYDTGTEDHMPPERVCDDELGAPYPAGVLLDNGTCGLYIEGGGRLNAEELVADEDQLELDREVGIQDEDQTVELP